MLINNMEQYVDPANKAYVFKDIPTQLCFPSGQQVILLGNTTPNGAIQNVNSGLPCSQSDSSNISNKPEQQQQIRLQAQPGMSSSNQRLLLVQTPTGQAIILDPNDKLARGLKGKVAGGQNVNMQYAQPQLANNSPEAFNVVLSPMKQVNPAIRAQNRALSVQANLPGQQKVGGNRTLVRPQSYPSVPQISTGAVMSPQKQQQPTRKLSAATRGGRQHGTVGIMSPSGPILVPSNTRLSGAMANAILSSPPKPSARAPIHGGGNMVPRRISGAQNARPTNQHQQQQQHQNVLNQGDMVNLGQKIRQQQKTMMGQQHQHHMNQQGQINPRHRFPNQQPQQQNLCQSTQMIQRQQQQMMEVDNSDQFMEVDPETMLNEQNSRGAQEPGEVNESYAYLQQEIKDPASTIVQHQINGNEAKMLVILPNGEQRLITFEVPKEDCTVMDLLEQATIPSTPDTNVSLVSDPTLGINYIVEAGSSCSAGHGDESPASSIEQQTNQVMEVVSPVKTGTPTRTVQTGISAAAPIFCEGFLAVCSFCGMSAPDFNHCARCKRKLPENVKKIAISSQPNNVNAPKRDGVQLPGSSFYSNKKPAEHTPGRSEPASKRGRGGTKPRTPVTRQKTVKEPECLTISSDEEDDTRKRRLSGTSSHKSNPGTEKMESDQAPVDIPSNINFTVQCRTIRIGSHKYSPKDKISISSAKGISLSVPVVGDENRFVDLEINHSDILCIYYHFAKSLPVMFLVTTNAFGRRTRELLGMQDIKTTYFDPASGNEMHKKVTILPEINLDEQTKTSIKLLFKGKLKEVAHKEANDLLISTTQPKKSNRNAVVNITSYGNLSINTDDYSCLAEDQFLNDVIIEFYLNYFISEVISESDRHRTYVFNPFFYERLTRRKHAQEKTQNVTPEWRRFKKVEKWTKNVNIFEKDFLIIPINEHAHWFLAIICFPGMVCKPEQMKVKHNLTKKAKKDKVSVTIGNTTITPVNTITLENDEDSERDEAEGDEAEMDSDTDEEESPVDATSSSNQTPEHAELTPIKKEDPDVKEEAPADTDGVVKVPCILIFDSLAGPSRAKVVATLRDYLTCEHQDKLKVEKAFTRDNIPGASPRVPQQSNFTDCGLYVLQYVESFFRNPIKDFRLPIKTLKNWFEEIEVTRKREDLAKLLVSLKDKTKGEENITMPELVFPTQDGVLKPKPQVESKTASVAVDKGKKPEEDPLAKASSSSTSVSTTETPSTSAQVAGKTTTRSISLSIHNPSQMVAVSSSTSENSPEAEKPSLLARAGEAVINILRAKRLPPKGSKAVDSPDAKKHKGES